MACKNLKSSHMPMDKFYSKVVMFAKIEKKICYRQLRYLCFTIPYIALNTLMNFRKEYGFVK